MNDLTLALREMERSRDFWQQAHQRLCDELARVKGELERYQGVPLVQHKEVILTVGYAID